MCSRNSLDLRPMANRAKHQQTKRHERGQMREQPECYAGTTTICVKPASAAQR
jgi:hypothetical protein